MEPLVSVIMPCYNSADFLQEAVESILHQTYCNLELIIIDDCSTDNSLSLIEKLAKRDCRVKIIRNEKNKGISYSRNQGIINSEGKYLALMDADDIAYPDRLKNQIEYLEKHVMIDAVTGYHDLIDMCGNLKKNDTRLREYSSEEVRIKLIFECVVADSSATFRKSVIEENKICFPEDFEAVGSYKFWCELALCGNIVVLPRKFYQYRINENGLTQITKKNKQKQRYEWHDMVHDFYWDKKNIKLTKRQEDTLLKYTRGEKIYKLREEYILEKAAKQICKQLCMHDLQKKKMIKTIIDESINKMRWMYFLNLAGLIRNKLWSVWRFRVD